SVRPDVSIERGHGFVERLHRVAVPAAAAVHANAALGCRSFGGADRDQEERHDRERGSHRAPSARASVLASTVRVLVTRLVAGSSGKVPRGSIRNSTVYVPGPGGVHRVPK